MSATIETVDSNVGFSDADIPAPARERRYENLYRMKKYQLPDGRIYWGQKTGAKTSFLLLPLSEKGKYRVAFCLDNTEPTPLPKKDKLLVVGEAAYLDKLPNGSTLNAISGQFTEIHVLNAQNGRFFTIFENDEYDKNGEKTGEKIMNLSIRISLPDPLRKIRPRGVAPGSALSFDSDSSEETVTAGSSVDF